MSTFGEYIQDETASSLKERDYKDATDLAVTGQGGFFNEFETRMAVRRLTPTECARLQGFSDDYLNIIHNGKPAKDGPKYRALGNSMAVPCMVWIGKQIEKILAK